MTSRTLQRKLSAEGTSFIGLYHELRIETAARLLRQSDKPITEVAFLAGFTDCAHLCREFRRARNMSPREYRTSLGTRKNFAQGKAPVD
jgi:transcriptional regulator GlxA family with amidase domain